MIDTSIIKDRSKVIIRVHDADQCLDIKESMRGLSLSMRIPKRSGGWLTFKYPIRFGAEPNGKYPWCMIVNLAETDIACRSFVCKYNTEEYYKNHGEYAPYFPIIDYEDLAVAEKPHTNFMEVFEDLF